MIHTFEYMKVLVSEEKIEVERSGDIVSFSIQRNPWRSISIRLTIDEAEELRDMLTRALNNAEDVRVMEP